MLNKFFRKLAWYMNLEGHHLLSIDQIARRLVWVVSRVFSVSRNVTRVSRFVFYYAWKVYFASRQDVSVSYHVSFTNVALQGEIDSSTMTMIMHRASWKASASTGSSFAWQKERRMSARLASCSCFTCVLRLYVHRVIQHTRAREMRTENTTIRVVLLVGKTRGAQHVTNRRTTVLSRNTTMSTYWNKIQTES